MMIIIGSSIVSNTTTTTTVAKTTKNKNPKKYLVYINAKILILYHFPKFTIRKNIFVKYLSVELFLDKTSSLLVSLILRCYYLLFKTNNFLKISLYCFRPPM